MEAAGLGRVLELGVELEDRPAAVAWVPLRSGAELGERRNRERWRIWRPSALEAGWGELLRRVTVSQGLTDRWAWMEIRAWRMSCCTPEALECRGCFRRLNGTTRKWTNRRQNRTEGRGATEGGIVGRKEAAVMHTERERQQERREKEKGREEKREGGR